MANEIKNPDEVIQLMERGGALYWAYDHQKWMLVDKDDTDTWIVPQQVVYSLVKEHRLVIKERIALLPASVPLLSDEEIRRRTALLLRAFMFGLRIEWKHRTLVMDTNYVICAAAQDEHGNEILLKLNFGEFTIADLVTMAKGFTEDEIVAIGANLALNELKGN